VEEFLYLLKVAKDIEKDLAKRLLLSKPPTHVRVATLAPLSNYGFVGAVEGGILGVSGEGIVVGVDGREDIPRLSCHGRTVSYIADWHLSPRRPNVCARSGSIRRSGGNGAPK
jgi:hypothetical protein